MFGNFLMANLSTRSFFFFTRHTIFSRLYALSHTQDEPKTIMLLHAHVHIYTAGCSNQ